MMPINIDHVESQSPDPIPGNPRFETVWERVPGEGLRFLYTTIVKEPWGTEKIRQHLREHPLVLSILEKQLAERVEGEKVDALMAKLKEEQKAIDRQKMALEAQLSIETRWRMELEAERDRLREALRYCHQTAALISGVGKRDGEVVRLAAAIGGEAESTLRGDSGEGKPCPASTDAMADNRTCGSHPAARNCGVCRWGLKRAQGLGVPCGDCIRNEAVAFRTRVRDFFAVISLGDGGKGE